MASHWILIWKQGSCRKSITFDLATNMPIFFTAPSSGSYHAFVSTYCAMEASYFWCEHVFQIPATCILDCAELPMAEEFIAKENLHIKKELLVCEGVMANDDTVHVANLPAANDPTIQRSSRHV